MLGLREGCFGLSGAFFFLGLVVLGMVVGCMVPIAEAVVGVE
jgi:hypothetical protein